MDAIDKILDGPFPDTTKQVARNEAAYIEHGRAISVRRASYLISTAEHPPETTQ